MAWELALLPGSLGCHLSDKEGIIWGSAPLFGYTGVSAVARGGTSIAERWRLAMSV